MTNIQKQAPGPARDIVTAAVFNIQQNQRAAGVIAIIAVAIAFYSATSYVGGFMRAADTILDVPEGRPLWETLPLQVAFTAPGGHFLAVSAGSVVFTRRLGQGAR